MSPQALLNVEIPPISPYTTRPRVLKSREILFHQDESAQSLFVIVSGRLRLTRYTLDGSAITLQVMRNGNLVGAEAAYFPCYSCCAIAETETVVNVWPVEEFRHRIALSPEFALSFSKHLVSAIANLNNSLELRGIRSARSRILRYFRLVLPEDQETIQFDRPLKDIANELGLTPEVFYRTLSALEREGLIARKPRQVKLLSNDIQGDCWA